LKSSLIIIAQIVDTLLQKVKFDKKKDKNDNFHKLLSHQSQGRLKSVNCLKSAAVDDVIPKKSDFHAANNVTN